MASKWTQSAYEGYKVIGEVNFLIKQEYNQKHEIIEDSKIIIVEFMPSKRFFKYDFVSGKNSSNINILHVYEEQNSLINEKYLNEDGSLNTSLLNQEDRIQLKYLNKNVRDNVKRILKDINKLYSEEVKDEYKKIDASNDALLNDIVESI